MADVLTTFLSLLCVVNPIQYSPNTSNHFFFTYYLSRENRNFLRFLKSFVRPTPWSQTPHKNYQNATEFLAFHYIKWNSYALVYRLFLTLALTLLNFSACPIQTIGLTSDYAFANSSFTASSSSAGNEAFKGRLNGDGAWLPSTNDDANDYLQVDLQNEHFICAVATQGYPNARGWTRTYKLLLSLNSIDWETYQENFTDKVCIFGNAGQTPLTL